MILPRLLILGFPPLVVALAWWAAETAKRSHERPKDGLVVMLAEKAPGLNPFMPASEAERQIIDLVHQPLLRIDDRGRLQPALADVWRWSQRVTCWFADAGTAVRAREKLQAEVENGNRWTEWRLASTSTEGNALLLTFSDADAAGVQKALDAIADLKPQPVAFWRIERGGALREEWKRLVSPSPISGKIRRVWFDGEEACEFILAGPSQRVLDELRFTLEGGGDAPTSLRLLGEVAALVEPVLDLDIRPGQFWHDGRPVTAEDARATLERLQVTDSPLPVRDVLRHIQSLQVHNDGSRLQVVFRKRYGPALALLADVPVLPAAWLRGHPGNTASAFLRDAPPGAGGHRIAAHDSRSMILLPVGGGGAAPRMLFSFAASPLMAQIGMKTGTVDLIWPARIADRAHLTQLRFTPPRQRLVVLWNTRHPVLESPRLRAALAHAADIDALIRAGPGRLGRADGSVFAPGLWFSSAAPRLPHDLEKARRILADEGWPQDVNGVARSADREFRFTLLAPGHDELHVRTARLLAGQWRALGALVKVDLAADAEELAEKLRERRFDAVLADQRFEASWDQSPWWHSSQSIPGGTNFCGITNPRIDLLLEALAAEFEPQRVPERVRDLESQLLPLSPMLTLFTTHEEAAAVPGLPGDSPPSGWTLRALTSPARHDPPPAIQLKLRVPE